MTLSKPNAQLPVRSPHWEINPLSLPLLLEHGLPTEVLTYPHISSDLCMKYASRLNRKRPPLFTGKGQLTPVCKCHCHLPFATKKLSYELLTTALFFYCVCGVKAMMLRGPSAAARDHCSCHGSSHMEEDTERPGQLHLQGLSV